MGPVFLGSGWRWLFLTVWSNWGVEAGLSVGSNWGAGAGRERWVKRGR